MRGRRSPGIPGKTPRHMKNKVLEIMQKNDMIQRGDMVIVALSGGADSVCLLHVLNSLKGELGIFISAAHVNHLLRGKESERDEAFVRKLCKEWNIELSVARVDAKKFAEEHGKSIELAGREIRYAFFDKLTETMTQAKIATAHTLSDNMETALFNIARGTSLKGLCAIPPVRDNVIRPLIEVTRDEVEEYLKERKIEFVTDSTNLSDGHTRNFIRHHIVKDLRTINPSIERAFQRLIQSVREDEGFIANLADEVMRECVSPSGEIMREPFQSYPKALRSRVVLLQAKLVAGIQLENQHVEAILDRNFTRGTINLSKDFCAEVTGSVIRFVPQKPPVPIREEWQVTLKMPVTKLPDGRMLKVRECTGEELTEGQIINKILIYSGAEYDTINGTILRNRREGDRFRQKGRMGSKSLKKLFNEEEIPVEQRDNLAILEYGGEIAWIEDFGVSEYFAVNRSDQRAFELSLEG